MSVKKLKEIIQNSNNIVFFGGAGVSTESNIPDFRSANGLYNEKQNRTFSPEQILSHSYFMRYTEDFYKFYKEKMIYTSAKPNKAHLALSELEKRKKVKAVITQNIDGLHQMAGSNNVLELHGSIHRNNCMSCGKFFDLNYVMNSKNLVPHCDVCGGIVKPDVVLYEEALNDDVIENTVKHISNAEVLIIGGTSLVVYPAAGLVRYFKGKHLILINKSSTPYDKEADMVINDSIGNVLDSCL
jgi:NAD-dependent deacetylase